MAINKKGIVRKKIRALRSKAGVAEYAAKEANSPYGLVKQTVKNLVGVPHDTVSEPPIQSVLRKIADKSIKPVINKLGK